MAPPPFQAFILCGPGMSLSTFTSNPAAFPKALIPIANRPMIWYPLQWCYRAGITDINLITPPESQQAIQAALSQNPHLTSLSGPKPSILAPSSLTLTTGTADIFRLAEIQKAITGDFMILPCDFVCEIDCSDVLESWVLLQGALGGSSVTKGTADLVGLDGRKSTWPVGESVGRRGGLTVFYNTANAEGKVIPKDAETDLAISTLVTTPAVATAVAGGKRPKSDLVRRIERLVVTMPTDTLNDVLDDGNGGLDIRHAAMMTYQSLKVRSQYRDAHLYVLPYWVKDFIAANAELESMGEDVVGWWARACWQAGVGHDLGLSTILQPGRKAVDARRAGQPAKVVDDQDLAGHVARMTSTFTIPTGRKCGDDDDDDDDDASPTTGLASRVPASAPPCQLLRADSYLSTQSLEVVEPIKPGKIPPVLSYFHPTNSTGPFVGRVDTVAALLSTSLRLAAQPAVGLTATAATPLSSTLAPTAMPTGLAPTPVSTSTGVGSTQAVPPPTPSPFGHPAKITHPDRVPRQCRVEHENSLLDANVTVGERANIKESVIGANCEIGSGARLVRCVLFDGVVVGENVTLSGCVVGFRARLEGGARKDADRTDLRDCEIQEEMVVPWGTDAKNETFMASNMHDDIGSADETDDGAGSRP